MEVLLYKCAMYLSCVCEVFLLCWFLQSIFPVYEDRRSIRMVLTAGCAAIIYTVNGLGIPSMNLICGLCVFEIYIWLTFRVGWRRHILYLVFIFVLFIITEFVFLYVYRVLGIDMKTPGFGRVCILFTEKLFELAIVQVLRRKCRYLSGNTGVSKAKNLFIQPVSVWLLLNGILLWGQSPLDRMCIFAGGILSIISCIADFALVDQLLEAEHSAKEKELLQLKTALEQDHYRRMDKVNREYAGYLHEMRHIVQTIQQFSESENKGELNKLSAEASGLLDRKSLLDTRIYLKDPIANAILTERAQTAREKNIRYDVSVQPGLSMDFVDETDKIRILGNLIDNALEAAEKCADGYVLLDLHMENDSLLILKVINSVQQQDVKKRFRYLTTKEDWKRHGFGLKNVNELADKYYGLFDITEEKNEFIALLALSNVQKTEKK